MPEEKVQVTSEQMNAFLDWLKNVPEQMARLLEVIKKFYEMQEEVDVGVGTPESRPDAPRKLRPGGTPQLRTIPITPEQLDELSQARANAEVKERALAFIKGFIAGLMVMA